MNTQPEQQLENNLIKQLQTLNYKKVVIKGESDLLSNLKTQLEIHNNTTLSEIEFSKILNHLNKGNIFERAKILRDKMQLTRDDGTKTYLQFLNQEKWCQNEYQVAQQITQEGKYKNRYDVTLLVNGLPLVQIELKRRGLELKEAFNQVNRYQRHSFASSYGLFQYVQIFVISNGVNTKYYANNRQQSFSQTFFWTDKNNKQISKLEKFAEDFLEPCHLSKMISKYIVLAETNKILMVLRPYQYYAVEELVERVKTGTKNAYIWHTTGSGKTLTSFKASQIIMRLPNVHKVVFVVDRRDLDYQTTKEFNSFSAGSVDGTDNTSALVKQFAGDTKLIVTTIQKLNNAVQKKHHLKKMENLKDKKMVFIFDECHRTQFGETHTRIKNFFENTQLFGFTGTPIFAENAIGKRTTKDLFEDCIHKYVITDAIRDGNVLKFAIEYVGKYKQKDSATEIDINVEDIDKKELLESPERLTKIADYIIANHGRKTHAREFTGMFCVSRVDTLIKYYDIFKAKKEEGEHNLKIATIFTYKANEEDKDATGYIADDLEILEDVVQDRFVNVHSREKLEEYIEDYNQQFNTKFSTRDGQSFYNYYNDIARRVKRKEIDILLVVNMFLTGFDSKPLNTLYVDKNLRHHGLIQAFSRTNRILNSQKSHGNIICFRNLKESTDDAIALYSNKDAKEVILMKPYEDYVGAFNTALNDMKRIVPTIDSVDELPSEVERLQFVMGFRELMRLRNTLEGFSDFTFEDLNLSAQEYADYMSKYLDIYDSVKSNISKEKVSILDDVDFQLELIHRDEINVAYILALLAKLKESTPEVQESIKRSVLELLSGEPNLRSKKELIEKFIVENLPSIDDIDDINNVFDDFWNKERAKAFKELCEEEGLNIGLVQKVVDEYLFTEQKPMSEAIVTTFKTPPKILDRKPFSERVIERIVKFVETFIEGV